MKKPQISDARRKKDCELVQREATFTDFFKLICLFTSQKEMRPYFGLVTRVFMKASILPVYLWIVLHKWHPTIISVQQNGRVVAGMTFSRFGIFENAAFTDDPAIRLTVFRLIRLAFLSIVQHPHAKPILIRTLNPSIAKWIRN